MKRLILLAALAVGLLLALPVVAGGFFDGDGSAHAAVIIDQVEPMNEDPGIGGWCFDMADGWHWCLGATDLPTDDGWAWSSPRGVQAPVNEDPGPGGCGSYVYRCYTNIPDYWNNTCYYEDSCGHRIPG